MHKSGSELGPATCRKELRQFFAWLRRQIMQSDPQPHNLAGDKNTRRKITRIFRSFLNGLEEVSSKAPAFWVRFNYISQEVRDLFVVCNSPGRPCWRMMKGPLGKTRVWRDQIGVTQAQSVDLDRSFRVRETELLAVAWIGAPFIGADHPYDSIKRVRRTDGATRSTLHSRRAVDERRRRFLQGLDDKKCGLVVWRYFEEFRRTRFQKKREELNKLPPLEECIGISGPTEAELESISEMCRARRGLKLRASSLKHAKGLALS